VKKRLDEKAKTHKQLAGLGGKIKSYCRTAISQVEKMTYSNGEKAEILKVRMLNISNHYQERHNHTYKEGSILFFSIFISSLNSLNSVSYINFRAPKR